MEQSEIAVTVDWDRCEGHGLCVDAAPGIFRLDETYELEVMTPMVPAAEASQLRSAVRMCPVAAISSSPTTP